jgi:hypothetical protein
MMYLMDDLPDNCEYRFTISAVNGKGISKESPSSTSIMIERPLPAGWNRYFDEKLKRFYYANLKTATALWHRPDTDPYFCEEVVTLMFTKVEISYLHKLYDEEMAHFRAVLVDRWVPCVLCVYCVYSLLCADCSDLPTISYTHTHPTAMTPNCQVHRCVV